MDRNISIHSSVSTSTNDNSSLPLISNNSISSRSPIRMKSKQATIPSSSSKKHGWVKSSATCMICLTEFGIFNRPHHCRCCGIVVCDACSKSRVIIEEFKNEGNLRVCNQCYWGQVVQLFNI